MIKEKAQNVLLAYTSFDKYWPQYLIISCLIIVVSFLFPQGKSLQYVYQLNDIT